MLLFLFKMRCIFLLFFEAFFFSSVFSIEREEISKSNGEMCMITCDKTYPLHTYPSAEHLKCCKRGCRFYVLIQLVYDGEDLNSAKDICLKACKESYNKTADNYACSVGCNNQVPTSTKSQDQSDSFFYGPILYIQNVYKKLSGLVMSSWAVYTNERESSNSVIKSNKNYLEEEDREMEAFNALAYQTPNPEREQRSSETDVSSCFFDVMHFIIFKVLIIFLSFMIIMAFLSVMRIVVFESLEKKFQKLSLVEHSEYLVPENSYVEISKKPLA